MRNLVAIAVGLSLLAVAGPARAILTITDNASFISVDSGAPIPVAVDNVGHSVEGTTGSSSLTPYANPAVGGPGHFAVVINGSGDIQSSGGAVDADSVFDIQFTTDTFQWFSLGQFGDATVSFSSSDGRIDKTFQGVFSFKGEALLPGVEYHLVAGLSDTVGSFTVQLATPEPPLALLALAALAGLTLRRAVR